MSDYRLDQRQGFAAEYLVAARATQIGYTVCWPQLQAAYDMILEMDGQMWRVQVKTAEKAVDLRSRNSGVYLPNAFDWLIAVRMSSGVMWRFIWPTEQKRSITLKGRDNWQWTTSSV